jgi:uncharacterized protein YoxC
MEDIMKADIFFFIASIAMVTLSIFMAVILFFVLKAMRAVQRVIERIEAQSEEIANDVNNFRSFVYKGSVFASIISLLKRK